jgi:hypothetical protein
MAIDFKVGIVCDDYKLEKFKLELVLKGFINFKFIPKATKNTTAIIIDTTPDKVEEIRKICQEVEAHFTALKN